jgi:hypothetical protein
MSRLNKMVFIAVAVEFHRARQPLSENLWSVNWTHGDRRIAPILTALIFITSVILILALWSVKGANERRWSAPGR